MNSKYRGQGTEHVGIKEIPFTVILNLDDNSLVFEYDYP